jgi:predicted enzyme related to lactoylglutathione lyase/ketosteroid isomerase-like protein
MFHEDAEMTDENLIRTALDTWQRAFCRKDADALMALYAPEAVCYDAIPPFSDNPESMRRKVLECFPYFPEGFAIETRDLRLNLGSDLANIHFLWRFTDLPPDHPAGRHWLRSSIVWRKEADGGWLIVHDHCSAPFDPYTEKAVLSPDAAGNAAPDTCGEANPAGWFEIYVADMERAKAFYTAVFGYEFTRLESPIELWAFPMQPTRYGASGALARVPGLDAGGNSVIVYFSCADCGVQAARAAKAGGEVVKPKFGIGQYGHIALARDSEGNMIGLHSMQ